MYIYRVCAALCHVRLRCANAARKVLNPAREFGRCRRRDLLVREVRVAPTAAAMTLFLSSGLVVAGVAWNVLVRDTLGSTVEGGELAE